MQLLLRRALLVGLFVCAAAPLGASANSAGLANPIGWENRTLPGGTAFAVELPAGALTPAAAARYTRAAVRAAAAAR